MDQRTNIKQFEALSSALLNVCVQWDSCLILSNGVCDDERILGSVNL